MSGNNQTWLIYHKTKPNQTKTHKKKLILRNMIGNKIV